MAHTQRPRPTLHFTPARGWMNDPHGIVHVDDEYHMFYQYVPEGIVWDPAQHWGHAVSADLVRWRERSPALIPTSDELGCWSGSVVLDERGPVLFYTRPTPGDWGHGLIVSARARRGMDQWERTDDGVLIEGPPDGGPGQAVVEFRDPTVRREGDRWVMILGAGLTGHGGCVLRYSSSDLVSWNYDGVLASSPEASATALNTGTFWECPQLIEVDGQWVLLISVADWAELSNVVYALGHYDGRRFTARSWGRFGYSRMVYATTAFRDRHDRPCTVSWLRESGEKDQPPEGSPWASAQSLVHELHVVQDRLVVTQHSALAAVLPSSDAVSRAGSATTAFDVEGLSPWRITLDIASEPWAAVTVDVVGVETSWALHVDPAGRQLQVRTPTTLLLNAPMSAESPGGTLDVVVDADILEVTWSAGEGLYAARVPVTTDPHVTIRLTPLE